MWIPRDCPYHLSAFDVPSPTVERFDFLQRHICVYAHHIKCFFHRNSICTKDRLGNRRIYGFTMPEVTDGIVLYFRVGVGFCSTVGEFTLTKTAPGSMNVVRIS